MPIRMTEKSEEKTPLEKGETIREDDGTVQGAPETAQPTTDSTGPGVGRGPEPEKDE